MRGDAYPMDEQAWARTCARLENVTSDPGTRAAIRAANRNNWRDRKWISALAARLPKDTDQ